MFKSTAYKGPDFAGHYTVQVAPEDCTGCSLCVMVCPAKDKGNPRHKAIDMAAQAPLREVERDNYAFFLGLPEADRARGSRRRQEHAVPPAAVRILRRLRRLRRDAVHQADDAAVRRPRWWSRTPPAARRSTAATCRRRPTRVNADGRGPAWANSLFEDNAEFGYGLRLSIDQHEQRARAMLLAARAAAAVRPGRRDPVGRSADGSRHPGAARAG